MSAFVQSVGASTGGSQTTSLAKAYNSNNAAGNFLVCCVRNFRTGGGSAGNTVTDSAGNTWVEAPHNYTDSSVNANDISLWYVASCKAGANTVTVSTVSSTNAFIRFVISEYSYSGTVTYDIDAHATGNSTSYNSGSLATTGSKDILIGFVQNETNDADTYTVAGGWTFRQQDPSTNLNVYDQLDKAPGSYSFSGTVSVTANWAATLYAFKVTPPGGVTPVQSNINAGQSGTAVALAFASNNKAGSLLLCTIRGTVDATSVTDSAGNSWTQIDHLQNTEWLSLWYAENAIAGANTVTAHFGSSASFVYMTVSEYTGVARHNSLNVHGITSGNSTNPTAPSVNASNGDLVFGYCEDHTGNTITAGTGYALRQNNIGTAIEDQLNVAAGSFAPAFGMASDLWVAGVATFKPWGQNAAAEAGDHTSIVVNAGATSTKAFGAAVSSGDLLLVCVYGNQTNWALTDDKGNTYTKLLGYSNRGDGYFESFWWAIANAAGTPTITFKNNSASQETALQFEMSVFSPPPGAVSVDQTATNTGTSATPEATVSSTGAAELVIGMQLPFGFPTSALTGFAGTRAFGSGQQPIIFAVEPLTGSYTPGVNMASSNIFSFLAATFQVTQPVAGKGVVVVIME